jgi:4-azaleucine resistance transporter AzlC
LNAPQRLSKGFRATLPLALGCTPFGLAYGAVAHQSMAGWQVQLMSLTVFAGTAQFIGATMLAQGISYLPILITGLLLNLRLVLMSAALAPHLRRAPRLLHPLIAQMLTDESFAITINAYDCSPEGDPLFAIGSGLAMYVLWQLATAAGVLLGATIPAGYGLEYALSASIVCLLFLLVRTRRMAAVAALGALLSILLQPLVSATWSVMVGTLLAATWGVL